MGWRLFAGALGPRHDDERDFWATGHWATALYFALHTCIWAGITMFECGRTIDMAC